MLWILVVCSCLCCDSLCTAGKSLPLGLVGEAWNMCSTVWASSRIPKYQSLCDSSNFLRHYPFSWSKSSPSPFVACCCLDRGERGVVDICPDKWGSHYWAQQLLLFWGSGPGGRLFPSSHLFLGSDAPLQTFLTQPDFIRLSSLLRFPIVLDASVTSVIFLYGCGFSH